MPSAMTISSRSLPCSSRTLHIAGQSPGFTRNVLKLIGNHIRVSLLCFHVGTRVSISTRFPVLVLVDILISDPLRQFSQLPNVPLRLGDHLLEVAAVAGHLELLPAQVVKGGGVSVDGGHHAHDILGAGVMEELGAEVADEVLEGQGAAVSRLVHVQLDLPGARRLAIGIGLLFPDLIFGQSSETFMRSWGFPTKAGGWWRPTLFSWFVTWSWTLL